MKAIGLLAAASFLFCGSLLADPPPSPAVGSLQLAVDDSSAAKSQVLQSAAPPVSDAEKILRLQRSIEADEARLADLSKELDAPDSSYAKAEEEFQKLDDELAALKRKPQEASDKQDVETIQSDEAQIADLTKRWTIAKDRFQLEIEQRKTQQAVIATLEAKLQKDREALAKLKGVVEPVRAAEEAPPPPPASIPKPAEVVAPDSTQPTATSSVATSAALPKPAAAAAVPPAPAAPVAAPIAPPAANVPAPSPAKEAAVATSSLLTAKPDPKALSAATQAATKSAEDAADAEREAASITERVELLRANIELQRKLKTTGRLKVDKAEDALRELNEELTARLAAGGNIDEIGEQIRKAQDDLRDAKVESRSYSTRLDELQTELAGLQDEQITALSEADQKRQAARDAQLAVDELNNPLSVRNLLWWFGRHGSATLIIILTVMAVLRLSRKFEDRLVGLLAGNSRRGGHDERTNRAKTLVTVLQNLIRTGAIGVGTFMALDEVGVPIGPLLGGAAVIGLAVAFGAQSLIKDYFTGFMVLLEQQYIINDVIRIGDITGQVERITLRMTVLRDLEGRVHFVPHGQIEKVTNLTHGWSRAVFDISVAYKEDVDRCIDLLRHLAVELSRDPRYGTMILEEPQMLGVDALGDCGVTIKFCLKTRPLRQWEVKRELLRRIKNRFDQLGIEIPYPQRTLHVTHGDNTHNAVFPQRTQHKAA
jgi:small conductance mechanosensitive channel